LHSFVKNVLQTVLSNAWVSSTIKGMKSNKCGKMMKPVNPYIMQS